MLSYPRLLLAALLVVVTVACGDDDLGLPPDDDEGLAAVFQPFFDPLGLEFTYGSVQRHRGEEHLALYVEPTGPATDEQYLERMLRSSAAIIPFLFAAFPDLESFDLCQEPVPTGSGDPDRPQPRTVVVLRRAQAASVEDWSSATLPDLIRAARIGGGGAVRVDDAIARLPAYAQARAEAESST